MFQIRGHDVKHARQERVPHDAMRFAEIGFTSVRYSPAAGLSGASRSGVVSE